MKTLNIFETFSGIGAQHKAITKINKKIGFDFFSVVATSDWDIRANITYNKIHGSKYKVPKISEIKKRNYLSKFIWSWDGKEPISKDKIFKLPTETIDKLFKAVIGNKNLGSIIKVNGEILIDSVEKIDVLTYSFPCQNLSSAGAFHKVNTGMSKNSGTRSGLLWEIERILLDLKKSNKLPKYLLLENVKSMLWKRNQKDFDKWIQFLEKLGYKTKTSILDARDFGIPQSRKRVFCLSILNYEGELTEGGQPNFNYKKKKIKNLADFLSLDKMFAKENSLFIPNDTTSRKKIRKENPKILNKNLKYVRTITTKQDRHPNSGTIAFPNKIKNKSQFRFLTPRETFKLMGFKSSDYEKANVYPQTSASLYKQAGNSIVVNILESIFDKIYDLEKGEKND